MCQYKDIAPSKLSENNSVLSSLAVRKDYSLKPPNKIRSIIAINEPRSNAKGSRQWQERATTLDEKIEATRGYSEINEESATITTRSTITIDDSERDEDPPGSPSPHNRSGSNRSGSNRSGSISSDNPSGRSSPINRSGSGSSNSNSNRAKQPMGVTMMDASAEEPIPMKRFMKDEVGETSLKPDSRLTSDVSAKSVFDFDRNGGTNNNGNKNNKKKIDIDNGIASPKTPKKRNSLIKVKGITSPITPKGKVSPTKPKDKDTPTKKKGSKSPTKQKGNKSPKPKSPGKLKSKMSPVKPHSDSALGFCLKKGTSHSTLSHLSSTHSTESRDTFDINDIQSLVLVSDNARVFANARPKRDMLSSASWHSNSELRKQHTATSRWGSNFASSNDSVMSDPIPSAGNARKNKKNHTISRPSVRRKPPPSGTMQRQASDSALNQPRRSPEGPPEMPRRRSLQTPPNKGKMRRGSPPPPSPRALAEDVDEDDEEFDDDSSCSSSRSFASVSTVSTSERREDDLPPQQPRLSATAPPAIGGRKDEPPPQPRVSSMFAPKSKANALAAVFGGGSKTKAPGGSRKSNALAAVFGGGSKTKTPAASPAGAPAAPTRKSNAWTALLGGGGGSKTKSTKQPSKAAASGSSSGSGSGSSQLPFQMSSRRRRSSIVQPPSQASVFEKSLKDYGGAGFRSDSGVRYTTMSKSAQYDGYSNMYTKMSKSAQYEYENGRGGGRDSGRGSGSGSSMRFPDYNSNTARYYGNAGSGRASPQYNNNTSNTRQRRVSGEVPEFNNSNTARQRRHGDHLPGDQSVASNRSWPNAKPNSRRRGSYQGPNSSSTSGGGGGGQDNAPVPDLLQLPYYDRFQAISLDSAGTSGSPGKPSSLSSLPYFNDRGVTTSLDAPKLPSRNYGAPGAVRRSRSASSAVRRTHSGGAGRRNNFGMSLLTPCPEEQIPSGSGRTQSGKGSSALSIATNQSSNSSLLSADVSGHSRNSSFSRVSSRGSNLGRSHSAKSSKSYSSSDENSLSGLDLALGEMAPKRRSRKKPAGNVPATTTRQNKN